MWRYLQCSRNAHESRKNTKVIKASKRDGWRHTYILCVCGSGRADVWQVLGILNVNRPNDGVSYLLSVSPDKRLFHGCGHAFVRVWNRWSEAQNTKCIRLQNQPVTSTTTSTTRSHQTMRNRAMNVFQPIVSRGWTVDNQTYGILFVGNFGSYSKCEVRCVTSKVAYAFYQRVRTKICHLQEKWIDKWMVRIAHQLPGSIASRTPFTFRFLSISLSLSPPLFLVDRYSCLACSCGPQRSQCTIDSTTEQIEQQEQ